MLAAIIVFALVLSAAALVSAVLTTSASRNTELRTDSIAAHLALLDQKIERTGNAALRAEVDDLRGAVTVLTQSNRREFGKLWAKLTPRRDAAIFDGDSGQQLTGDDELQAMLALQTAKPVQPQ